MGEGKDEKQVKDLSLPNEKEFTKEEIAKHKEEGDLWIVVGGRVLDVSKFEDHPGGPDVLEGVGGEDATEEFDQIAHSNAAIKQTEDWRIGKVKGEIVKDLMEGGEGTSETSIVFTVVAIVVAICAYYYLR